MLTDPRGLKKFYDRIADRLGSNTPAIDFEELAGNFRLLEEDYARQRNNEADASRTRSNESIVIDPHVLCVSSQQYHQGDRI